MNDIVLPFTKLLFFFFLLKLLFKLEDNIFLINNRRHFPKAA